LMLMAGFHDFSSSRMERQIVPLGYTFGWKSGGENLPVVSGCHPTLASRPNARDSHFGGLVG
jgi:hypothetical protein